MLEILSGFNKNLGSVTLSAIDQFQTEKKRVKDKHRGVLLTNGG